MPDKWQVARRRCRQQMPKLEGKISNRVYLLISRQYIWGNITKPLEEMTDINFLSLPGVGLKILKEIRAVIPAPS